MKNTKTIMMVLSCLILTSCSGVSNTKDEQPSNDTEITTESSINDTTTENDTTTIVEKPIDGSITISKESETTTTTISSETTTAATESIMSITADVTNNTINSIEDIDMIIPTTTTSEYITQEICKEISEYFNAMKDIDVETFQSKQLPEYNQFMDNYLQENSSNIKEMLENYHNNILKSNDVTAENTPYTSVNFNSIELVYPNDFDSIMNTMNYINQLDDITLEYSDYAISKKLSAYYELQYNIDYTLRGEDVQDFNSVNSGKILVLIMDNQTYLIMLT